MPVKAGNPLKIDKIIQSRGDIVQKREREGLDRNFDRLSAAMPGESVSGASPQSLSVNSNQHELVDVANLQTPARNADYQLVEFEVELFAHKYDALDYEYAFGAGLGVAAQFVNTTIVQYKLGSPFWGILPPFVAATTLTYTILDNKDKCWQQRHQTGMKVFTGVVTGIMLGGAFFFGQGIVLQVWPGDRFSLAAKLGVPGFALLGVIPIAFIEKHKAIAEYSRKRRPKRNCIAHPATVKIFEVIGQGIGADAGMSTILNLVAGFKEISSQNVVIISAAVAGANMFVEALPKEKYALIDGLKKLTDFIRTFVKAGALTSSFLILMFSIIAGTNESHIVPTWATILIACLLALFILPAVGYRTYTICSQPALQNHNNRLRVEEIPDNDDIGPRRLAPPPLALGQNPQNFYQSRSAPALADVSVARETDPLIPQKDKVEPKAPSTGCNIL